MNALRIGYGRVSTADQNLDAQADALRKAGVDRLFIEKHTGTKASRPEFDRARAQLRRGYTLVVTRMDRLGRSTKDLLTIVSEREADGVALQPRQPQPRRLRSTSRHRPDRGMINTQEPSGKPGQAPTETWA